jgi:outer membrane lipoprotein
LIATVEIAMRYAKFVVTVAAIALLAACATTPTPLAGDFAASSPRTVRERGGEGQHVRWGGEIIRVDPAADSTCFEILAHELRGDARPERRDSDQGRFLACRKGFYDPELFTRGRDITVTGVINGSETRRVGEYDYTYPRVAADVIYLWPNVQRMARYYDSYPWGFGPWGDPFWSPGWWGPPVVIVHRHHKNGK